MRRSIVVLSFTACIRLCALQVIAGAFGAPVALAQWQILSTGTTASLRGLSVVGDSVIWASGARGTVIRSVDAGNTWTVESIPEAARLDVRAIHARSALVAHAAATAGRIWRTVDGGHTWSLQYQASDTSVFLDAIAFFDEKRGIALGDPMRGRFFVLLTDDAGTTWREAPVDSRPVAHAGEAAFAASGTSLLVLGDRRAWIGSGGTKAQVFRTANGGETWTAAVTPVLQGTASQGIFSVGFFDERHGVVVGGDYQHPDSARGNAALTSDGGLTWRSVASPPRGYRSGVAALRVGSRTIAIAVGTSGSDISRDGGSSWAPLDSLGFNAVQFSGSGTAFAVGSGGRAARFELPRKPSSLNHERSHLTRHDR